MLSMNKIMLNEVLSCLLIILAMCLILTNGADGMHVTQRPEFKKTSVGE